MNTKTVVLTIDNTTYTFLSTAGHWEAISKSGDTNVGEWNIGLYWSCLFKDKKCDKSEIGGRRLQAILAHETWLCNKLSL